MFTLIAIGTGAAYGYSVIGVLYPDIFPGGFRDAEGRVSIYLEAAHPHDIITMLDQDGIALRGGHHCAQPTMIRFGVPATARASMAFYNKFSEIDALAESLRKVIKLFS